MTQPQDEDKPKPGYIPKPPSQADIDQVSQDQALITDEWAEDDTAKPPSAVPPPGSLPG